LPQIFAAHGTGAINIDGCRVGTEVRFRGDGMSSLGVMHDDGWQPQPLERRPIEGRFPANIIHDGSEEVIAAFPDHTQSNFRKQSDAEWDTANGTYKGGIGKVQGVKPYDDSWLRRPIFLHRQGGSDDRLGSKHPTVKPVDLMQWLCRLVTPPNGTVLDPFAGTGTTGEAAFREGFNAVLIEREEEYQKDIRRRMALVMSGPDERKRESIKAKLGDVPFEAGSLFA
jgi:site-specific DNA-methyltransferase (adenine-specific)